MMGKIVRNPQKVPQRILYELDKRGYGKRIFKNHAGFDGNVAGKMTLRRARKGSDVESDRIGFLNNGVTELGKKFDDRLIDNFKQCYEDLLFDEEKADIVEHDGEVYSRNLLSWDINFSEHLPEVEQFVTDEIGEVVRDHYGAHFKITRFRVARNYHVPREVVKDESLHMVGNYWHCDSETPDHLKMFVYLSDVTSENGPFHSLSREETKNIVASDYYKGPNDGVPHGVVEEKADEIHRLTGPTGSTALSNTCMHLHRAGIPAKGKTRDSLSIQFAPAEEPMPSDWIDQPDIYTIPIEEQRGWDRL
jgi:hypothetical protein